MRLGKWQLLAVCFVVLVALDQWTKYLAVEHLTALFTRVGAETTFEKVAQFYKARHLEGLATAPYIVHPAWWRMSYAENPGAAFSFGTGFTFVFPLIAIAVVVVIVRKSRELGSLAWALALGGLLGGAVGNLIDRLFRDPGWMQGHVVDFIFVKHFAVFNVADAAITCSAVAMVVLALMGIDLNGKRA